MEYRRVGQTGREVSVISLGTWNTLNRMLFEDAVEFIRGAHALGVNFFDTSLYPIGPHDTLAGPHTEVIFGRILQASGIAREDYYLSEKLWFYSYPEQSLDDQMNRSLFRLGHDYVDLVSVSQPRRDCDLGAVLRELATIVDSGRARAWGAMNWTDDILLEADALCKAEGLPRPQLVQIKYSVLRRNVIETPAWDRVFAETQVTLHPSDSLEGGRLAGKLVPERETGSDNGNIRPRFIERFAEYKAICERFDATPAQVALAFCLLHPSTTSILVGASSVDQLRENAGAIDVARRHGAALPAALAPFSFPEHHTDQAYYGRLPADDLGGFRGRYVRPAR